MSKEKTFDDHDVEEHPSYGMVAIHHRTGSREYMFGSSLKRHAHVVALTITQGERHHNLSRDWFYGRKIIAEVLLTPAQFAELITTPNTGSGVPCTINAMRDGDLKQIDPPPVTHIETEKVRLGFEKKTKELVTYLQEKVKEAEKLMLGGKAPNKKEREQYVRTLKKTLQEVQCNMPFVVDQFAESADRIVTAAKTEVDTFVTGMIHKTGLRELQRIQAALPEENAPVSLPSHADSDEFCKYAEEVLRKHPGDCNHKGKQPFCCDVALEEIGKLRKKKARI